MTRFGVLTVATALIAMPALAQPVVLQFPQAEHCYPAVITLSGPNVKHPGSVFLNTDGSWTVDDWATVREMAQLPPGDIATVGKGLLRLRSKLRFTPGDQKRAPGSCTTATIGRVLETDPITREVWPDYEREH